MLTKEQIHKIIENDTIKFNNGDTMVDVSTAYTACDLAEEYGRNNEREKLRKASVEIFCEVLADMYGLDDDESESGKNLFAEKMNDFISK